MNILRLNFKLLQYCGMWRSLSWHSGWKAAAYDCYTIVMVSSLFAFAVSQFVAIVASSENVKEFAHGSYMFLAILAGCGKSACVTGKRKEIIKLTNVLRNDLCSSRNEDEAKILTECERDARFNAIWYSALGGTSVTLIMLRSLIVDLPERNLPFEGWLPFGLESSEIGFWFAYVHQRIGHATAAMVNSSFDTLVPGLMMQTCAQIKILKHRIKALPRNIEVKRTASYEENSEEYRREGQTLESELLIDCIRHHVEIFQFADSLNDIFGNVVLLQFALSSLILCVNAYETSAMNLFSTEFAAIMLYLCCMIIQIFIYCYYGGELTLQSVDICDAVYRMDRSSLSIKTKKSLMMIMMRALRPITFTCGNVITVSLDSFNSLIKLSYSVYNVLQQSTE